MCSAAAGTPRRTGRPTRAEASELTRHLRDAALGEFLEKGFTGTTMEAVARAAGVTKRTLYGRYPDKHTLFLDVARWAIAEHTWTTDLDPVAESDDLAVALTHIARSALARALHPDLIRLNRILMLEAERFPELVRTAQSRSWSPRMQAVMTLLHRHQQRGDIQLSDPEVAAEQFLVLVTGMPSRLALFGLQQSAEDQERFLRHAVSLFLEGALTR